MCRPSQPWLREPEGEVRRVNEERWCGEASLEVTRG